MSEAETRNKLVAGCTVPCKHNDHGKCDKPQFGKGMMPADKKCDDYEKAD